ncbi:MAG: family 43 glycosylhydrolase [Williamsia sp.]|nr:family 43 glycosylhydrolase [Williamsia sp.]
MKRRFFFLLLVLTPFVPVAQKGVPKTPGAKPSAGAYQAYLFAYFTGNSKAEESIRFAISRDGYNFRALNGNKPVLSSAQISSTGGVRDPHILRGADGKTFYMVATDMVSALGWNSNRAMVLLKSTDLINWTSHVVNIQKRFSGNDSLLRVWAPQTIYDDSAKKYMVYFSLKHGKDPDKIYYAYANPDFTDLETEPRQLFFSPDNAACIDGDIVKKDRTYYLFFKTEDRLPGIKIAVSNHLTGGYTMQSNEYVQQTKNPVEGAGVFKLNGSSGYILMYDMYTSGRYQFTKTTDFKNFKVVDEDVNMNFHPRHGTVMPVTGAEEERLIKLWLQFDDVITDVSSPQIKKINLVFDTAAKTVLLPVKPGTNLQAFNPGFGTFRGVSVRPALQNFAKGPVQYTVDIAGRGSQTFQVSAKEYHNPALTGLYADPDITYAEKTKKFYIYPTSDGFTNWMGTYFKTFSSTDLVNWKDEGRILELGKDVSWAKTRAWAPCIMEKKINGQFKYFFYFCAEQKIGVAVSDNPTGPFVDLGKPLIDKRPEGFSRNGQVIDPDVFHDPQSGKYFLYWGNGYMAGAELNDDMVSIKPETIRELTPNRSYNEGTHVFYRNGTYYFLWSQNDTRDPNYQVRYGTAHSPLGKITVPENNLVIVKDSTAGIWGTGHNSTIQVPGKDEWYLVYHRFNYPRGINMAREAGYNREVCIDRLEFNADGTLKTVVPTHEGIRSIRFYPN